MLTAMLRRFEHSRQLELELELKMNVDVHRVLIDRTITSRSPLSSPLDDPFRARAIPGCELFLTPRNTAALKFNPIPRIIPLSLVEIYDIY